MSVATFEGVVENGQIRLKTDIHLPDKTKVYVIVPETQVKQIAKIFSPPVSLPRASFRFQT